MTGLTALVSPAQLRVLRFLAEHPDVFIIYAQNQLQGAYGWTWWKRGCNPRLPRRTFEILERKGFIMNSDRGHLLTGALLDYSTAYQLSPRGHALIREVRR